MKTLSYEIFEKARDMFDYIFMSVGEGGGISMLFAGFQDLFELYKTRIPSLVGVYLTNRSSVVDDLATVAYTQRLLILLSRLPTGSR